MDATYHHDFTVRPHEAGAQGNLKFVALLNYLQEIAGMHVEVMGVARAYLAPRDLTWVLVRSHVRLERYPFIGDKIRISTWSSGWDRLLAIREFLITDPQSGLSLGCATTAWVLFDLKKKRPARPMEILPSLPHREQRTISDPFNAILALPDELDHAARFAVRMHDLDMNAHVNNAIYIEWALESVPPETWDSMRPMEVESHYLSMAFYGDTIDARIALSPDPDSVDASHTVFQHSLHRASDDKLLTLARSRWAVLDRDDGIVA